MAEVTTLDFTGRRKPPIVMKFPRGKVELDPNLEVEDMGEALVVEEAIERGRRLLQVVDLKDKAAVREAKETLEIALDMGRDYIEYLAERTKPGQKLPKLSGPEVDTILTALSGNESVQAEVLEAITQLADRIADAVGAVDAPPDTDPEGEQTGPLASKRLSRKRSSRSAGSTSGSRSTGGGSRGGSSAPMSETPEPASV